MSLRSRYRLSLLPFATLAALLLLAIARPASCDATLTQATTTADSAGSSSTTNAAAAATSPNAALQAASDSPATSDNSVPSDPDVESAKRIDHLLKRAEHLRFGVLEGKAPMGDRPRPSLHSYPPHASLQHSLAADKRMDIPSATALYAEAASLGSAQALNELGEIALFGEGGVPANLTTAVTYLNASAQAGNPEAQHHLAVMAWLGLNDEGRSDEGFAMLYEYFSAMGGNPLAKMSLGYRHLFGLNAPKSCEAAVAYYQQVSEEVVAQSLASPVNVVLEKSRLSDEKSRTVPPEEDEDVVQYYQHSAENGDVGAQVALGHLHFYGARGFEQNPERAARYFKAAAAQGDTTAMSSLGQMHVQGLGVPQNNETAFDYLSKAAEKHNAAAQNGLGYLYLHGQGTKQDYKLALKWFKKASDQGNAEAQFNLGAMYFAGLGVDKKYTTALQYFTLAGHQGHTRALFNLGQMHLNGLGTIKSCAIGVKLHKTVAERGNWAMVLNEAHRNFLKGAYELAWMQYARAAEEGYEVAQANSAWMLDQGLGSAMADVIGAKLLEAGSSDAGEAHSLALLAAERGVQFKHVLAHRHWSMAAQQGNVDALRMLGDYAFEGLVTSQHDYKAALKFYNQAAEQRNAQAMFNLGYMHERGLGTNNPDFHLAKRYYDSCLEADPDSVVPVKLALLKLYAHAYWQEFFMGGAPKTPVPTKSPKDAAHTSTQDDKAFTPARTLPGPVEWVLKQIHSTGLTDWVHKLMRVNNAYELFLTLEDVLLAVLCAALAIVVYIRSQR